METENKQPEQPKKSSLLSITIIVIAVAAILLIGELAILRFGLLGSPADIALELANNIANDLQERFNLRPEVLIEQQIVVEQFAPIFEVAVAERKVIYDYNTQSTWLGSTKKLYIKGTYTAKAGFDMKSEKASITIEKGSANNGEQITVIVNLPEPEILSMEMVEYKVIIDENGWWNKNNAAEREEAVRKMKKGAREQVIAAGILREAKQEMQDSIKKVIKNSDTTVKIEVIFNWGNERVKK